MLRRVWVQNRKRKGKKREEVEEGMAWQRQAGGVSRGGWGRYASLYCTTYRTGTEHWLDALTDYKVWSTEYSVHELPVQSYRICLILYNVYYRVYLSS